MAKDINLLEQVFERSWNHYDEQLSKILNEAVTIFRWMEEVIPATEEALDRKMACSLPKTPHVKRRKIDEPQEKQVDDECVCLGSVDNRESEIVEAKLPRPLRPRRNTKASNRRSSKGFHSKQQKKAQSQAIKPARVTRASKKKSVMEKSVFEIEVSTNINGALEYHDLHETTQLNTTKSFIEHEKDMLCIGEINEKENVAIDEIVLKCLAVKLDDQLPSGYNDGESTKPEKPDLGATKDEENVGKITSEPIDKQKLLVPNNDVKSPMVSNEVTQSKIEMQENNATAEDISCNVEDKSQELLFERENEKFSSETKITCNDGVGNPCNDVADCNTESQENNNGMAKKVNSASNICQQGQVAKMKERLFEKITLPSSSTPTRQAARQSPKLARSPFRAATPKRLNSPITKQKLEEHFTFDCEMEEALKQSQDNEVGTEWGDKCGDAVENVQNVTEIKQLSNSPGPAIFKPIKPKNLLTGVHSMIKAANQKNNVIHQGSVTKQGNIVSGLYSFIKPKAVEKKPETVQERKQRLEDEAKRKEEARNKLIQQAEYRRQKEIEERKKRRQEREQRVAEAQAKKAQEEKEKQEQAQKRFEMMKKNEEKLRRLKKKEEEMKKKMREKKMAEAEAKRRQEENERITKMVEKEEEEKRKADYLQRRQEYEEMERRRKIEEQKKAEELRQEEHARDMQLQEERLRREIKEREAQARKRLEEKEKELKEMQEKKKIEKEKQEREDQEKLRREEQERFKRDEEERLKREKQEAIRMEEQERLKKEQQERLRKELQEKSKAEKERIEQELWRLKKEKEAKENERKLREAGELKERKERELKERKEKELKAEKENEINEREAYHQKRFGQKQFGEPKRTFDKAELDIKQSSIRSPMHPAPHSGQQSVQKVQCTTYNTPTLSKTISKKKKSPSLQTYDINSLSEDDSTDDEEDPAQAIPSWASGTNIKRALAAQIKSDINPHEIFVDMLEPPKLEKMFPKLRARFFKRTSSACWDHPPRPFKTMLY